MEQLGHISIHLEHALSGIGWIGEGGDNVMSLADIGFSRRENLVGDVELRGVDERLSIKPQ